MEELITLTISKRIKGTWDRGIKIEVPFTEAVQMIVDSKGKNFENTKVGDIVVTSFSGSMSTILKVKNEAGIR